MQRNELRSELKKTQNNVQKFLFNTKEDNKGGTENKQKIHVKENSQFLVKMAE